MNRKILEVRKWRENIVSKWREKVECKVEREEREELTEEIERERKEMCKWEIGLRNV